MADLRPRRSIKRVNYKEVLNLKVPVVSKHLRLNDNSDEKLYRLKVIEEDETRGWVNVSYIGYSSQYDEWRPKSDIIDLSKQEEIENTPNIRDNVSEDASIAFPKRPFNLYEDLAARIKFHLVSSRKQSPCCRISMSFDCIYFEGLVRRALRISKSKNGHQVYTISKLSRLNDVLGERWFIRGINKSGDFCYVKPGTVEFYLQNLTGKLDFQLSSDGTLSRSVFGVGCQLIFSFVRGDGILSQWNNVLQLCK